MNNAGNRTFSPEVLRTPETQNREIVRQTLLHTLSREGVPLFNSGIGKDPETTERLHSLAAYLERATFAPEDESREVEETLHRVLSTEGGLYIRKPSDRTRDETLDRIQNQFAAMQAISTLLSAAVLTGNSRVIETTVRIIEHSDALNAIERYMVPLGNKKPSNLERGRKQLRIALQIMFRTPPKKAKARTNPSFVTQYYQAQAITDAEKQAAQAQARKNIRAHFNQGRLINEHLLTQLRADPLITDQIRQYVFELVDNSLEKQFTDHNAMELLTYLAYLMVIEPLGIFKWTNPNNLRAALINRVRQDYDQFPMTILGFPTMYKLDNYFFRYARLVNGAPASGYLGNPPTQLPLWEACLSPKLDKKEIALNLLPVLLFPHADPPMSDLERDVQRYERETLLRYGRIYGSLNRIYRSGFFKPVPSEGVLIADFDPGLSMIKVAKELQAVSVRNAKNVDPRLPNGYLFTLFINPPEDLGNFEDGRYKGVLRQPIQLNLLLTDSHCWSLIQPTGDLTHERNSIPLNTSEFIPNIVAMQELLLSLLEGTVYSERASTYDRTKPDSPELIFDKHGVVPHFRVHSGRKDVGMMRTDEIERWIRELESEFTYPIPNNWETEVEKVIDILDASGLPKHRREDLVRVARVRDKNGNIATERLYNGNAVKLAILQLSQIRITNYISLCKENPDSTVSIVKPYQRGENSVNSIKQPIRVTARRINEVLEHITNYQ